MITIISKEYNIKNNISTRTYNNISSYKWEITINEKMSDMIMKIGDTCKT